MQRLLAAGLVLVLTGATWSVCQGQNPDRLYLVADDVTIKALLDDPGRRHGNFLIVREGHVGRFTWEEPSCELLGLFEDKPSNALPGEHPCLPRDSLNDQRFIWLLFGEEDDCAAELPYDPSWDTTRVTVKGYFTETPESDIQTPWRGEICVATID